MIYLTEGDCDLAFEILEHSPDARIANAKAVTEDCVRRSSKVCCGWYGDRPACMWGLIPPTLLSNRAYLWLITTDIVTEHRFLFIRYSQRYVEEMLSVYPRLFGDVSVHNKPAQRWLKWLGAGFKERVNDFIPFEIRKKNG